MYYVLVQIVSKVNVRSERQQNVLKESVMRDLISFGCV